MNKNKKEHKDGTYLSIGVGLGVMFGIIFDNLAIGIALGLIFGQLADSNKKKSDKQEWCHSCFFI